MIKRIMPRITVTLTDEQDKLLAEKAGEGGEFDSKSEVMRSFITEHQRLSERVEELEAQIERLQAENERLQNDKRLVLEQREENTELREYVEEQRKLTRYQERRQRLLDDANILKRWKWKLTGVPVDDRLE